MRPGLPEWAQRARKPWLIATPHWADVQYPAAIPARDCLRNFAATVASTAQLFLPMKHLWFPVLLLTAVLAGCSSMNTRAVVDLAPFKRIYVIHRLTDDHHIDELLVRELQQLGHEASSGPRTLLPENTDAILTYEDRWEWDFKTYLIELNLELHTARTEKKLADGHYLQQTPRSKPPVEVVHDLLSSLFKAK
jgi:hypothetical protein